MVTEGFKEVNKKEFEKFLKDYPNELVGHVVTICEPPLATYNDFTTGLEYPDSIVAKVILYDGTDFYDGLTAKYSVLERINNE